MGWSNYLVVPKMKLVIEISRNITEEDVEYLSQAIEKHESEDPVSVDSWTPDSLSKQKISDVAKVLNFYDDLSICLCDDYKLHELLLVVSMKNIDRKTFIVSEFELEKIEHQIKDYQRVTKF